MYSRLYAVTIMNGSSGARTAISFALLQAIGSGSPNGTIQSRDGAG
jgi:hypothetical protein